ncbi:MAG: ATP synthase F1 subunit gamma [Chitinophagales bacterium]|nr:ATP synthase F1 subunit gamma [Chitinophagales bacterium]
MANLKEVRNRIGSVKTTQQITKAMKLVAASKLKRAQDRITQMRPYSQKLNSILSNLMESLEGKDVALALNKVREPKNVLVVLVTSDKGLCGGFNSNLIKTTRNLLATTYATQVEAGNVTLLPIGKKGYDYFKRYDKLKFNTNHISLFSGLNFSASQEVSAGLTKAFLNEEYDVIELVYAQFVNAATQKFEVERFLPVATLKAENVKGSSKKNDYIFEPDQQQLLEELAPKILNTQFFKALLDTNASENGSRMVAMDSATNNAQEMIRNLSILYNRERQAAITKEILEIVGGAAALEAK